MGTGFLNLKKIPGDVDAGGLGTILCELAKDAEQANEISRQQ